LEKLCRPFSKQPSQKQKLTKLLAHEGWEILDVSEKDFNNWSREEKVENIKGWLKEAKARQVERGLIEDQWKAPI